MSVRKMLGLGGTVLKSNVSSLPLPYKLNFSITYWCQSRCLTCNIWQIKPKGELTTDEIREFAKKNTYFKWLGLTGGEPFLRSDIVEIIRAFKENSKSLYMLTFPTNSLCDHKLLQERISAILELGIPKVAITLSLDGNRELHDKIRGVPGNYDKAIANYKMLTELSKNHNNLTFMFGYTMSKFNQGQFQRIFEDVKKDIPGITANDFHINIAQTSEHYYQNKNDDIRVNKEMAVSDLEWIIKNRGFRPDPIHVLEHAFTRKQVHYMKTGLSPMPSRGLDASLFMDSFGNVFPSIMWDRKIGSIREAQYDLRNIWHGEAAEMARQDLKKGMEPAFWTSCEAYQTLMGNISSIVH